MYLAAYTFSGHQCGHIHMYRPVGTWQSHKYPGKFWYFPANFNRWDNHCDILFQRISGARQKSDSYSTASTVWRIPLSEVLQAWEMDAFQHWEPSPPASPAPEGSWPNICFLVTYCLFRQQSSKDSLASFTLYTFSLRTSPTLQILLEYKCMEIDVPKLLKVTRGRVTWILGENSVASLISSN